MAAQSGPAVLSVSCYSGNGLGASNGIMCVSMDLIITILPVVTKYFPIPPVFFIAMQVHQSYNSSTNG